jgi:hypothetical protein
MSSHTCADRSLPYMYTFHGRKIHGITWFNVEYCMVLIKIFHNTVGAKLGGWMRVLFEKQ